MSLATDRPSCRARTLVAIGGLMGAAGVAAAAAGAHLGGGLLPTAAQILMVHAAAVVGLVAFGRARPGAGGIDLAAAVIAFGAIVFGGDLAVRDLAEVRLVPYAAPVGGVSMIVGWLIAAVAAAVGR